MKKLSGITEGIINDIAKRDLTGNNKREDESIEKLFDYLKTHYEVKKSSEQFELIGKDKDTISRNGIFSSSHWASQYTISITHNRFFIIKINMFTRNIPAEYDYFVEKYDARKITMSDFGLQTCEFDNIKHITDVVEIINDIIDVFHDSGIKYKK